MWSQNGKGIGVEETENQNGKRNGVEEMGSKQDEWLKSSGTVTGVVAIQSTTLLPLLFTQIHLCSFSRSHRNKDRERDKREVKFVDHWERDSADPLGSILTSRIEKLGVATSRVEMVALPRSHSMISRKQGEAVPRRVAVSSRDNGNSKNNDGNDLLPGSFFLVEFAVGNSSFGGEGWTSTLAEMPTLVEVVAQVLCLHLTVSTSGSGGSKCHSGSYMAEALVQLLTNSYCSQLSVKTQRREELAIKQSKQLIPVTPTMPKGSVQLNVVLPVNCSLNKPALRASEMNIAVKNGKQQPSLIHHGTQSTHGGHVKSDTPKTSGTLWFSNQDGKMGSPCTKRCSHSNNKCHSKVTTSQHAVAAVTSAPARNSNSPKHFTGEHKAAALNPIAGFTMEKRPSLAQTKSRNDFFNLLKKKTKHEVTKEVGSASPPALANENGSAATSNGGTCEEAQRFSDDGENNMNSFFHVYPDEEEAAFLHSLGWEENSGDDEGLTEEEINAFYQEYMKLRPTLKVHNSVQPKPVQSIASNLDGDLRN
ncbi:Mitogen-activated protein kinase kinase kinase 1, putative isoform 1 [Hibiscus syriacus]|uniref:Mitogen-activated protein kinase kinase kinase 1, putative isoform 1 n=1 Tax=Hibiscus syriacus TaxID=106335 RepID=A0A6A3BNA4_HIBSY|nr:Mitogen-activated protein kinase kinase kinase 1, putative isoform 1 [Hibiscus syriacus]